MIRLAPLLFVWISAVAGGFVWMVRYESRPSVAGVASSDWPDNPQIENDDPLPVLVMFAHPKCPCTRASVGELSRLMADCQGLVRAYVAIIEPPRVEDGWSDTVLRSTAEKIPGVQVIIDKDAELARTFHAETSGETFFYVNGQLRFHGGITVSRGHRGENAGRSSIAQILHGSFEHANAKAVCQSPVYGCALHDSISPPNERP